MRRQRGFLFLTFLLLAAGCLSPTQEGQSTKEDVDDGATTDTSDSSPSSKSASRTTRPPTSSRPSSPAAPSSSPSATPAPTSEPPAPPPPPPGQPSDANWAVAALLEKVRAASADGTTVDLPARLINLDFGYGSAAASPRMFTVEVRPALVLRPQTWAEIDGQRVELPFVEAYEGNVAGAANDLVRVTFTWYWAYGIIRVGDDNYVIREGLNGNLPTGGGAALSDAAGQNPPKGTRFDPPGFDETAASDDCPGVFGVQPYPYVAPMTDLGATSKPLLYARIILDADREFTDKVGPTYFPFMVAMLNELDATYTYEVGVRFLLVGVHAHTPAKFYPSPAASSPFAKMGTYWDGRPEPRDIIHLFTGQSSDYAQANCIGGVGDGKVAYAFTPLNWMVEYDFFHQLAFAHELGHLFSAHHHYGNHVEAVTLATIMITGYTPGHRSTFSTISKSVIRGWSEEFLKAKP